MFPCETLGTAFMQSLIGVIFDSIIRKKNELKTLSFENMFEKVDYHWVSCVHMMTF